MPRSMNASYKDVRMQKGSGVSDLYSFVPWGVGIPLRHPEGLYKGYIEAILGKPSRGTALGVQPWNLERCRVGFV